MKSFAHRFSSVAVTFPLAEGLRVQQDHLTPWLRVLRPGPAKELARLVAEANSTLTSSSTGYDVLRGTQLNELIHNKILTNF